MNSEQPRRPRQWAGAKADGRRKRARRRLFVGAAFALVLTATVPLAIADTVPNVTIEAPSSVDFDSAHVSGSVNPNGGPSTTSWRFEFAQDPSEGWSPGPGGEFSEENGQNTEATPIPVEADLAGLAPGTKYLVRLLASNEAGEASSEPLEFETEAVSPPAVSDLQASAVTTGSAHLSATVNSGGPGAGEASTYRFECEPECPGLPGEQPFTSDGTDQLVEADATGLEPHREYTLRLVVTDAAGLSAAAEASFTTGAVPVEGETLTVSGPLSATSARFLGVVNPHNWTLSGCRFEFGTDSSYGQSVDCDSDPHGNAVAYVGADAPGLAPNTTYHYRLVTDNGEAPTVGGDQTLTTPPTPSTPAACPNASLRQQQAAVYLPDCRAYELISSAADASALRGADLAEDDQERVALGYIGPAGEASTGGSAALLATRTANGWERESMTPPASELLAPIPGVQLVSPDLSASIQTQRSGFIGSVSPESFLLRVAAGETTLLHEYGALPGGVLGFVASDDLSRLFHLAESGEFGFGFGETPGQRYIYEMGSGTPGLISRLPDGTVPSCGTPNNGFERFSAAESIWHMHVVSTDGSRAFFHSSGENCSSPPELYMRDLDAEATTLISGPVTGGGPAGATLIQATPDGSQAFFTSPSRLDVADSDENVDLYRHTIGAGNSCLSCDAAIPEVNFDGSRATQVAEDGSRAYFHSTAVIAPGGAGSEDDIYVWREDGTVGFVAPSSGMPRNATELTPDGSVLVFRSSNPDLNSLTGSENGGQLQLYRYDDRDQSLACISCPQDGSPASGGVTLTLLKELGAFTAPPDHHAISADGSLVAFTTTTPLDPGDVNNDRDIYQWRQGRVGLITDGTSNYSQLLPGFEIALVDVSRDGRNIVFANAAKLTGAALPEHPITQLYTARIDGGFPEVHHAACQADGCRPHLAGQSPAGAPASAAFSGEGNVRRHKCPRGRHRARGPRGKVRCVRNRHGKPSQSIRQTNSDRRAGR